MAKDKPPEPASLSPPPPAPPEEEPKAVPLTRQATKDKDAPPTPPTAEAGPLPRTVHQNVRAPEGVKRFKVRSDVPRGPVRYVLAHNEDEARDHYLKSTGLSRQREEQLKQLKRAAEEQQRAAPPGVTVTAPSPPDPPVLVVTALAD